MLPETDNPVSTPTLVIFGCALAVTTPAVSAAAFTLAKLVSSSASGIFPLWLAKVYGTVIVISIIYCIFMDFRLPN